MVDIIFHRALFRILNRWVQTCDEKENCTHQLSKMMATISFCLKINGCKQAFFKIEGCICTHWPIPKRALFQVLLIYRLWNLIYHVNQQEYRVFFSSSNFHKKNLHYEVSNFLNFLAVHLFCFISNTVIFNPMRNLQFSRSLLSRSLFFLEEFWRLCLDQNFKRSLFRQFYILKLHNDFLYSTNNSKNPPWNEKIHC